MLYSLSLFFSFSYKFKPFHTTLQHNIPTHKQCKKTSSQMMHHCCSSSQQGHIMGGGTCTCGMFHPQTNSNYSLLYSNYQQHDHYDFDPYSYTTPSSSSSSSVDCTLSLATPSTRLSEDQDKRNRRSSLANFFCSKSSNTKGNNIGSNSNNDSLLARRCASCDTTSTPLWRNGPRGPKVKIHYHLCVYVQNIWAETSYQTINDG